MAELKAQTKLQFFCLLFLLFPIASSNIITLKFKGTGKELTFINPIEGRYCPDKMIIDGELKNYSSCKYKFENKTVIIKLKFGKKINNFYRMFANISNIIEIDLSQFNTSLVNNMAYMFENCTGLIFANLSNLNLSSVTNMEYMFTNCISLKSIDFTNIIISKIPYHKNIFFHCSKLKYNNFYSKQKSRCFPNGDG